VPCAGAGLAGSVVEPVVEGAIDDHGAAQENRELLADYVARATRSLLVRRFGNAATCRHIVQSALSQ
jgi:hypothetical protein